MNHLVIRQDYLSSTIYHAVLVLLGQNNEINFENARKNYEDSKGKYESFIPITIKEAENLNQLIETGTTWNKIRNVALVCQFILIILSVIGYLYILREIQKRLKKN